MTFNPNDHVDNPLTLESLAERVAVLESRMTQPAECEFEVGIPQVPIDPMLAARKLFQKDNEIIRADAAEFNTAEVKRLKKENAELAISVKDLRMSYMQVIKKWNDISKENELLRAAEIVRTFNQQSVS